MGGGFSIQKFPPIITRDPLPSRGAFVGGISKGGRTQECGNCRNPRDKRTCRPCRLVIAQGVSASGAKLYREYGSISVAECNKFTEDSAKVNANEMAFDEFKAKLLDGKYYARQENGYCSQLMMTAEDLGTAKSPNEIDWNKARRPRIRRMTVGGGYSSSTKLYIKPAIPFRFKFNNETVEVSVMTLFHPSPIRVENVQHDAMLTLGDPADPSGGTVLLIPLAADNRPGTSGTFFSRVVSYMPGILQPNPATGQYDSIDAPTGKDWNLSMLFPGTPNEGETVVASPYYAWFSVPELEEYLKQQTPVPSPWPDRFHYSWREKPGTKRRFVMLAEPIPINTFDMQTIRMLPATPADEALPFIFEDSVVYSAALPVRQADGTVSACRTAPTPTSSIATPPSQRERFENKACDPFAQITPQERLSPSSLMTIIGSVIGAIAIFVGVYLALKYATDNNWGPKLMQWGRAAGKAIAGGPGPGASAPPKSPPSGPRDTERKEGETFAKENTAAIEARKAAAEKKKREAEIARAKADAEAEAKAKADAEAEAKAKADAEAEAEEERKSAERRAARAARTPLQKAREKRRFANDMIIQRTGDITIAEGELANLETYLRNAETDTAKATQQKAVEDKKRELETLKADLAQAKRELKEADDEIAQLNKEIAPPKRRVIAMELTDQQEAQLETLEGKVKALESQDLSTVSPAKKQSVEAQLRALRKGIAEMRASPDRFADIAKALQTEIAAIRASETEAQDKALATMRAELAQIKTRNARVKDQQAEAQKKLDQILARQREAAGTGLMTPEEIRERDAKMERDLKALEDQVKDSRSAAAGQAAAANVLLEQGKRFQDAYAQAQAKREVAAAETEKEDSETLARNLREANALLRRSQGTYARATQGRNLYTGRGKRTRRTHQR